MVNAHQRRNYMVSVRVNGIWVSKDANIKEGVANAFHGFVTEVRDWRPSISGISFTSFENADSRTLENPFSEEELFLVMR